MGETSTQTKKKKPFKIKYWPFRLASQTAFFALYVALAFNIVYPFIRIERFSFVLPVMVSPYSYTPVQGAFNALQVMLSKPEFPWIPLAVIMITGAMVGRLFCGWACPLGFIQDVMTMIRGKMTTLSPRTHKPLLSIKYIILGMTLLISGTLALSLQLGTGADYKFALGAYARGPFLAMSPDVTIFTTIPNLVFAAQTEFPWFSLNTITWDSFVKWIESIPAVLAMKFFVLGIFVVGSIAVPRFWCRYLCPLGGFLSIFSRASFLGLKRDPVKCTKCPHCERACPMQIKILELDWQKINHPDCILCMECVDSCPENSITLKAP